MLAQMGLVATDERGENRRLWPARARRCQKNSLMARGGRFCAGQRVSREFTTWGFVPTALLPAARRRPLGPRRVPLVNFFGMGPLVSCRRPSFAARSTRHLAPCMRFRTLDPAERLSVLRGLRPDALWRRRRASAAVQLLGLNVPGWQPAGELVWKTGLNVPVRRAGRARGRRAATGTGGRCGRHPKKPQVRSATCQEAAGKGGRLPRGGRRFLAFSGAAPAH